ncbi:recombination regulator RecX [soil metagenome]
MQITAIEPQKRHPERVNVHVDGSFRLALAAEIANGAALRAGDAITEERLGELERQDQRWKAREAALVLLSFRPRTRSELRGRLLRKDFPEEVAEETVAALVEKGLVSDDSFAEVFVRDRTRLRPKGKRRLVQELRAKGVDAETAHAAVEEVWEREEVSELDLAREAAAKWSPRAGEEPLRARRRLFGFLQRRGFSGDAIRQVMDEVLSK